MVERTAFYFPKLDGLRFIAFLLVFIHHFPPLKYLEIINQRGWMGVELFFILSSFLLTKLLVKEYSMNESVKVKNFFLRRILRIWPLYFFFILTMLIVDVATNHFSGRTAYRLFGLFTFTDDFYTALYGYNEAVRFISHLWTISLEEQYYVFLPFLIPLFLRLPKKTVGLIALITLAFFFAARTLFVLMGLWHPFIWVLPIQADAFIFGTLYGLGMFDRVLEKLNCRFEIALGLLLIVITFLFPNITVRGYSQIITYPIISFGFLLIVDGAMRISDKIPDIILAGSISRYLGKVTYGLYVFHPLCIFLSIKIFPLLGLERILSPGIYQGILFLFTLAFVILTSALSYEIFEKHFLKIKKKYSEIQSRPI